MSFFDDDPPTQQRASASPSGRPRMPRPPQDQQQIWARRGAAIGMFVLVLLAVAVLINSCVSSARVSALEDYNQEVVQLGQQSESNIAEAIQTLAQSADQDPLAQRQQLDQLAADSRELTERARDLDTPGGLDAATWNLATALSLRADALARIADRIATARGTSRAQAEEATKQIAGQMQAISASDLLWQLRVTPYVLDRFKDEDMNTEPVTPSIALKDDSWTNTATVATRIGGEAEDPRESDEPVAPGTHGHALQGVSANGAKLNPGAPTRIPSSGNAVTFEVTVANSSDNDAENVSVSVTAVSEATKKKVFDETKRLPTTKSGSTVPVRVPVNKPSGDAGSAFTVTVEIKPVRGEENTDNNKETYQVIFE